MRILLVEDDRLFVELVEAQLRRMPGVESRLEVAGTLAEALAKLGGGGFGLVITDLDLPDSKGLATVEALARSGDQVIIVLTGDPNPALRADALDHGAYDLLSKDHLTAPVLERLVRLAAIQANTFALLHEGEARFRSLIDLSTDWYWEQDEELRFTRFDGRTSDLAKAALGRRPWEMPVMPLAGAWHEHRAALGARQPFRDFEYSRAGEDGALHYVSASGVPVHDRSGRFRGYRGTATDITARKRAEEDLRRFRLAMDTSPDMILLVDRATMRHIDVNSTACRLTGYSREELLARGPADILPLPPGELERLYDRMIADPSSVTGMRSHYRCKDGSQLPFESTRRVLRSGDSWIIAVISRDIRQRLAAESALMNSEARFRSLTALSSDWYWEQDEQFRVTFMSSITKLGLDAADYLGKHRWDTPALNLSEADWQRHRAQLERHEPFRDFEVERAVPGGGSVWMALSGEPVFDADGRFAGYRGVGRDITERRQAAEQQASHLRYQERVARFGQSALAQRQPAELVEKAVQAVLEALVAEAVAYLDIEPGAGGVVLRAVVGVTDDRPGTVDCPPGSPIVGVMHSGLRALVNGAQLPFTWAHELRSVALVPVRGENRVRGILCVCDRPADAFGAEQLNFVDAAASVLSTALQRIDSESRLAFLAQFDPLTGLPNRTLLADRFSQMIVQAKRRESRLAVLFIDLDGFKAVNDTLGHVGGDELLKEVAVRLQSAVRGGDTVARISGDEFAIVLADLARPEDAALVAQKVIDRVAATVDIAGKEVFVTASVGIASFPGDGDDANSLIGAADAAMYRAKQSGRNGFQFFTAEINQRSRARTQLGAELRRALERDEFTLFYQPKYDLNTRRAIGAEALLRWRHPERGLVSPAEFIPVLEETGLIVPVGDWVLQRACEDLRAWQAAGRSALPVAVNLSARQFRDPALDSHIKSLVEAGRVAPRLIELEITESHLMHDPAHAIQVMRALCDAGMGIAIDDFGTGYSSLAYLRRFPVGALKIDRSFVKDMSSDKGDATIVRTIIEMAHSLGFTVVAEGVETEEQATFLRLLRCDQAQGFLFAKPMPREEFLGKILNL